MLALLSWAWFVLMLNNGLVRADIANDPHMKSIPVNIANQKHLELEVLTCFPVAHAQSRLGKTLLYTVTITLSSTSPKAATLTTQWLTYMTSLT